MSSVIAATSAPVWCEKPAAVRESLRQRPNGEVSNMSDSKPSDNGAPTFCTVVNCIDGRAQLPVIQYLVRQFHVEYVDIVSDTGPAGVLAHDPDSERAGSMYRRIDVSIEAHKSRGLAIAAHHDCWANPRSFAGQIEDLRRSAANLRLRYSHFPVLALWVGRDWTVKQVHDRR